MRRLARRADAAACLVLLAAGPTAAQAPSAAAAREALRTGLAPAVLVEGEAVPQWSLRERMAHHGVPGVSIAVVRDGRLDWTGTYGLADVAAERPVTEATLFQAASISKPVAALAALQLVEEGRLDLDVDVNRYLESWQVPSAEVAGGEHVTLRRLVTHTAGLTVHGFRGYARGEDVPTTVEVLDGSGPANSPPVRVDIEPGGQWRYSGGGYTVMQAVFTDVLDRPFPEIMRERVLDPVGMTSSTYRQPLPDSLRDEAATAHDGAGAEVEGKWHTYPEMAAAGLWTTPTDLASYILEVQRALRGESEVLPRDVARAMVSPHLNRWGLGPALQGEGEELRFAHGGSNRGFRAYFFGTVDGRSGAAVMTNGAGGSTLIQEILRALAPVYGWSWQQPEVVAEEPLTPAEARRLAGTYEPEHRDLAIRVRPLGGRLRATAPGQPTLELIHTGADAFITPAGMRVRFDRNDEGDVVAFTMRGVRFVRGDRKPRVHVIATGGTIASRARGNLSADDLVEAVPELDELATITTEQFSNVGSSQITPDHWLRLSRRVQELYAAAPDLAGVVVTHGTDTMEETAFFLDLTVADPRPVIVTGSMRPPSAVAPEGAANLLDAVRVAVSAGARDRGTLVVMNDEVFSARDVTKSNTSRLDAFVAPRAGPVGVADPDRVVFHRPAPRRRPHHDIVGTDTLPDVAIVYSYGGADGTAIRAFLERGIDGLVIASVGRGNLPAPQRRAAAEAARRGIPVVISSRTNGGRVPAGLRRADRDGSAQFVGAGRLNPQKARVLLALALLGGDGFEAIADAFLLLDG